jgi:hypothetical protein
MWCAEVSTESVVQGAARDKIQYEDRCLVETDTLIVCGIGLWLCVRIERHKDGNPSNHS